MLHATVNRLLSSLLLVTIFFSTLPPALPTVAAPVAAPALRTAVASMEPPPTDPPAAAESSAIPASQAEAESAKIEPEHSSSLMFDGTFSEEYFLAHEEPGPFTFGIGTTSAEVVFTVPTAGIFDSVTLDAAIDTSSWIVPGGAASIQFRPVSPENTAPWSPPVTVTWFNPFGDGSRTVTNKQITIGATAAYNTPLEVKLTCAVNNSSSGTLTQCNFNNLRFYTETPPWRFATPTPPIFARITDETIDGISPQDGAYLVMSAGRPGGGAGIADPYHLRGPVLGFPAIESTLPVTVSLSYAYAASAGEGHGGLSVNFRGLDGSSVELISLGGSTVSQLTWSSLIEAVSSQEITTLSEKRGFFEIAFPQGMASRTFGIDDFAIYVDGQPLDLAILPIDQLTGKCTCDIGGRVQHVFGDPVNTFSGAFYLSATDITTPNTGAPLAFERTYVSTFAQTPSATAFGPGWRHRFEAALALPGQLGGETNTIIYEAPTGNRMRFYNPNIGLPASAGSRFYIPGVGVRATLWAEDSNVDAVIDGYILREAVETEPPKVW